MPSIYDLISKQASNVQENKGKLAEHLKAIEQQQAVKAEAATPALVPSPRGGITTPEGEAVNQAADLELTAANKKRAETIDYEQTSNSLLKVLKQSTDEAISLANRAHEYNTGNVFQQLAGIVAVPYLSAQARTALVKAEVAKHGLSAINAEMQSSAITSNVISTRVTQASAAEAHQAVANAQILKAADARIEALKSGASHILELQNMDAQQLDLVIKAHDVNMNEARLALATAKEKRDAEMHPLRKQELEARVAEAPDMRRLRKEDLAQRMDIREAITKDKEARKTAFDIINYAITSNGGTPIDSEHMETVLANIKNPMYSALYENGVKSMVNGVSKQGNTPAEAAKFRQDIGYTSNSPLESRTLAIIDAEGTSSKQYSEAKTGAAQIEAYNQAIRDKLMRDQEEITTDKNSLAKPATWESMKNAKLFSDDPLFKNIIAPQITDNIAKDYVDPEDLFRRIGTAIKNKQTTIHEAATLYQNYGLYSIGLNNHVSGLTKLTGLSQTQFKAKLPIPKVQAKLMGTAGALLMGNPSTSILGFANIVRSEDSMELIDLRNISQIEYALSQFVANSIEGSKPDGK